MDPGRAVSVVVLWGAVTLTPALLVWMVTRRLRPIPSRLVVCAGLLLWVYVLIALLTIPRDGGHSFTLVSTRGAAPYGITVTAPFFDTPQVSPSASG